MVPQGHGTSARAQPGEPGADAKRSQACPLSLCCFVCARAVYVPRARTGGRARQIALQGAIRWQCTEAAAIFSIIYHHAPARPSVRLSRRTNSNVCSYVFTRAVVCVPCALASLCASHNARAELACVAANNEHLSSVGPNVERRIGAHYYFAYNSRRRNKNTAARTSPLIFIPTLASHRVA